MPSRRKTMSFPRRNIEPNKNVVDITQGRNRKHDQSVLMGFPVRQMVNDAKDVEMKVPDTEVIIDTGKIEVETTPEILPEVKDNIAEEYGFTPLDQDNLSFITQVDENGVVQEGIKETLIVNDAVTIDTTNSNTTFVNELEAEHIKKANQGKANNTANRKPLDPAVLELKNVPLEELVFRVFTEYELDNLPVNLLTRIIQSRHRIFVKKFGSDSWDFRAIWDYGDKREELKRKILLSNPK